jgi:cytochrome c oxidase assembly protein subunit 15
MMTSLGQGDRVHSAASPDGVERSRAVALWLFAVAAMVFMMVVVGGATRLTGSGLSITEWRPISGALPPLSDDAWSELFAKYRDTAQYRLINQGIGLNDFKVLFWWEWAHRLLARGVGVVFAVPFGAFLVSRRLPRRLIGRCVLLFALGGLQGVVGWWMVRSGLEGRAAVAPERLAIHLGLALILFAALIWTGLDALTGDSAAGRGAHPRWRLGAAVFAVGVYVQCLMGALVAGNGGGLVDNDWPLMGGRLFPDDYWRGGLWPTLLHGRSAVQFDHRMVAYGLLTLGVGLAAARARMPAGAKGGTALVFTALGLLILQVALGVATLLLADPAWLALVHQANAVMLFGVAVALARTARRA